MVSTPRGIDGQWARRTATDGRGYLKENRRLARSLRNGVHVLRLRFVAEKSVAFPFRLGG